MITVVGLGVQNGDITLKGAETLKNCDLCIVKTKFVKSFAYIEQQNIECVSLDSVFDNSSDFDELNFNLASEVLRLSANRKSACYAVDGSGVNDNSVLELKKLYPNLNIIAGVSRSEKVLAEQLPCCSYKTVSMYDILCDNNFFHNCDIPLIITDIDNKSFAGELKIKLLDVMDGDSEISFFADGKKFSIMLYELDMQKSYDYQTCVFIPSKELISKKRYGLIDLLNILQILRGENGCPWDKVQTHASIRGNCIEEAYELVEAIDLADDDKMCEEVGDVLLQAMFHAQMGKERGAFTVSDVISTLCEKLIFRHSHIFGGDTARDSAEALVTWNANKAKEKGINSLSQDIETVPKQFPSLLRAYKVIKKCKNHGSLKINAEDICLNISSILKSDNINTGELLLQTVMLCVALSSEPELALTDSLNTFVKNFQEEK